MQEAREGTRASRLQAWSCLPVVLALAPLQGYDYNPGNPRISPEVLVVRNARSAVVCVEADYSVLHGFAFGGRPIREERVLTGSGVVVYEDGYIVTNYHVIAAAESGLRVRFEPEVDERVYPAELLSFDAEEDLALLKVQVEKPLDTVRLGTSSDIEIGERVLAIGNSYGQGLSVSAGIVSGLHRNIEAGGGYHFKDLLQTDASINPGNSGGPVLNMRGELIGISTVTNLGAENMGYAIPVDTVVRVLQDQLLGSSAARTWLGLEVATQATGTGTGIAVTRVYEDGPAAQADVRVGDLITHMNGAALGDEEDFQRRRASLEPDQRVLLGLERDGAPHTAGLRGWNKVDGILFERLGMTVETLAIGRRPFVHVQRVSASGAAAALGLREGDVIDAVRLIGHEQAWHVQTPLDLAQLVAGAATGAELAVDILRDENRDGRLVRGELYKGTLAIR